MKIQSLSEILGRLIDLTLISSPSGINDFTPGSTIRSIYEAIALELQQYYILQQTNIKWGIENGVYEAFDFNRKEARRAYGDVTITLHSASNNPIQIPRGTQFMSRSKNYSQVFQTMQNYMIPAGQTTAVVTVYCNDIGVVGNVPIGIIDTMGTNILNLKSVTNDLDFLTGQDEEPLENVKRRFREFVETRGRATKKAIEYGVRTVDDITGVYIDETTGWVRVYAHDNNGDLPDWLASRVEDVVEEYRPSGIRLDVLPVIKRLTDVNVEVVLNDRTRAGNQFNEEIRYAIRSYLNRMQTSEDLIISDLTQTIHNLDDNAIYDVKYIRPNSNILVDKNEIIRAGTVNVTITLKELEAKDSMIFTDV